VNAHEIITGDFTRDTEFSLPSDRLQLSLEAKLQDRLDVFDASELAKVLMGDSIFSNMMIFGAAWQRGLVPVGGDAIRRAIELNGAAPERNLRAFELGRWAVLHQEHAGVMLDSKVVNLPKTLAEKIAYRADHLVAYQGKGLARKYRKTLERIEDAKLREAVAKGYHKLLSYKDEYEVARLHLETEAKAREAFEGELKVTYHLAPPLISKMGANGRPVKKEYGAGMQRGFRVLARLKRLRGTPLDVFGYSAERKMERAAAKRREELLAMLNQEAVPQAAE